MNRVVERMVRTPISNNLDMNHLSLIKLAKKEIEKHLHYDDEVYSVSLYDCESEDKYLVLFQDKEYDVSMKSSPNKILSFEVLLSRKGDIIRANFTR